jgi:hypothetical protein
MRIEFEELLTSLSNVCLMLKLESKMKFIRKTVNKVARVHHFHKTKVQMEDHWMNLLIK